jgi:hypothetical protein
MTEGRGLMSMWVYGDNFIMYFSVREKYRREKLMFWFNFLANILTQWSSSQMFTYRISAILVPPFPITHPINSLGTDISCCTWLFCCWVGCWRVVPVRNWLPARAANAASGAGKWY